MNETSIRRVIAILVLLVTPLVTWAQTEQADAGAEWPSMRMCVADALQRTTTVRPTIGEINAVTELCYSHLHGQGLLNDFRIRRMKFTQQTYDERILLWMVVLITLSGVALAAVQLVASFKLATQGAANFDQQTELAVEKGKLSLKTSLTGLLILVCSFAFFWVFVYEIYVIHPLVEPKASGHTESGQAEQISVGLLQPHAPAASQTARGAAKPASVPQANR